MMQLDDRPEVPVAAIKAAASAWGMSFLAKGGAGFSIVQGLTILISDPARFARPSYTVALSFPYSPDSVGAVILFAGLIIAFGLVVKKSMIIELGLVLASSWAFFFGLSFLLSSQQSTTANTTAVWTYWFVCFTLILPAVISHSSSPKRKHHWHV